MSRASAGRGDGWTTDVRGRQPHVLREYALLADGERGALVGPRGDICWMCAPNWHHPSVFSSLIGGTGHYRISPDGVFVWGGYYEGASLIWRSRWVTEDGEVECREALRFPAEPGRVVLLRRVHALQRPARIVVHLEPRSEYDRAPMRDLHRAGTVWTARTGELYLRWQAVDGVRRRGDALDAECDLAVGEHMDFVLELSRDNLDGLDCPDPDEAWQATTTAWQEAVPSVAALPSSADARRSQAVLVGLTASSGGMVAAATTSLPERAEAGRNYDYRYVWIRDQCYAGHAGAACGADRLLDSATKFVGARLLEHGDRLAPAYTIDGEPVPDQRHLNLPGYPGGADIVGNWVNQQFQLDAFGEALLLFASAAHHDRLDDEAHSAMLIAAAAIERRWTEPDAGIWEIDNRPWTHSRLICAAGLRAAAAVVGGARMASWTALADKIVAETSATSLHPEGRWQRSPGDPRVDGALLLPGLRGAVPAHDPRSVTTLEAYLRDLTHDGYAYRFRHDERPLYEAEGAFVLCGFWTAMALASQGREVEARAWHERSVAACGPPQLFSEEYDVRQHQMRGNLPQAFVHALMLESSAALSAVW
jgi:GH15 family glucan-1,4-alpha-glucosidase